MRRSLLALTLLFAVTAVPDARAVTYVCTAPRCEDVAIPVPDGLKVPDDHVRVLLPRGYDDTTRRYPVLYLLHGAGDSYVSWTQNTDADRLTRALDMIVVMPDGGHDADAGWYSDWKDGSRQWETFHIDVMIPYIDANFRTIADRAHRAIAGLSMGGFGAMHYAARHPELFSIAAAFSGAVDMMYADPASGVFFTAEHSSGLPDDRVWGNQITDGPNWRANNPTDLAANLAGTTILLATGNGLPGGAHDVTPPSPSSAFIEHGVSEMNKDFVSALDADHIAHTDLFYGPGDHSWPYWRDDLAWALPQIYGALN